jgi:hypothetical protein
MDKKNVPRSEVFSMLKNSLVVLTLVSLENHIKEIDSLLSGTPTKPVPGPGMGKELGDRLTERLRTLEAKEFEIFLANLLRKSGFESNNRQHGGDTHNDRKFFCPLLLHHNPDLKQHPIGRT